MLILVMYGLGVLSINGALQALVSSFRVSSLLVVTRLRLTLLRPSLVVLVLNWSTLSRLASRALKRLILSDSSLASWVVRVLNLRCWLHSRLVVTCMAASGACNLRDMLDMNRRRIADSLLSLATPWLSLLVTWPTEWVRSVRLLAFIIVTWLLRRLVVNCLVVSWVV